MSDCLFCRIATREVAAHVIHDDAQIFASLDIYPIRPGHTLIVPKQYFPYFDDLPGVLAASIITLGQTLAAAMKRIYGVERVAFCSPVTTFRMPTRTSSRCMRRPTSRRAATSPKSG